MRKVPAKHIQWLKRELPVLENEGVISPETAGGIQSYYAEKTAGGLHWAIIAFSVLGSLLIGAGVILLFAHNWDDLSRPVRAVLSFAPVVIGSILSLIAVAKNGGAALRESAGIFHALAIGASIALIGQTYNVSSSATDFFLTWMLLALPLVFLLRSSGAGLIYLALVFGWSGVAQEETGQAAGFWLLILPVMGRLVYLIRTQRHSAETLLNVWGMLFTISICTGLTFERTVPGLWIIAYAALLSGAGLIGMHLYGEHAGWSNPPRVFGIIGIAVLAYVFTFENAWYDIGWSHIRSGWRYRAWGPWLDGGITLAFLAFWIVSARKSFRKHSTETVTLSVFPIIAILCFVLGSIGNGSDVVNALIFNAFMLFLGIMYVVMGCRNTRLRQLNGGMAILSLLLVTRFFDEDFGFMARGIVFITLGACFLTANLIMARCKKRKEVEA
jgi:uncharacterized membrane protein